MTLDEHVVRIRYEADLEAFNKAIAIAERETGSAVARMARVLGGLHQPFDALFEQLSALQEAANSFKLPAEQITALETLTDRIAANTAVLNNNLKEIRGTASSLARDIEGALIPLSDPQLEKNLEALKELFEGSTGDDPAASLANRIVAGAAIAGLAVSLAPGAAAVGVPLGFLVGFKLEEIVDAAASAIDAMMGLVSAEEQGVEAANDLLNRFNTIVQQTDDWATAQERVAKALADSAASLCTIAEKLDGIKQNGGGLPICCESGGSNGRPQIGRPPFARPGLLKPDGEFATGGRVFGGGAFLVGERGPEIFVPDRAGRILPNSFLSGSSGGGLGASFSGLTDEIQLLGTAIEEALGGLPEEFGLVADALDGVLNEALSGNIRSWGELREAALGAAEEVLGGILQSEEVRGEIGELADVIDGVLNQALSGSIDSWEDLGRVALDVLQQIATEILKTQLAGQGGGGGFLGAVGDQSEFLVAA